MAKYCRKAAGGALKGLLSASLLIASSAAGAWGSGDGQIVTAADRSSARQIDRWNPYIEEASARFGIPQDWIRRVMRAESGGRTMLGGRPITSSAGAMGLMQLMPATWTDMRATHGLGPDPHHPRDNILAGTAYLRAMYDRFGYPGLFAAYNAGPTRYAEHLAGGRRLPAETVAYVAAVGSAIRIPSANHRSSGLFVALLGSGPDIQAIAQPGRLSPLFVRLRGANVPHRETLLR